MTYRMTLAALALAAATPALATTPGTERLAAQLGLDPEQYTLNELVQISQVTGQDRLDRIEIIDKKQQRFQDAVMEAVENGDNPFDVEVSRDAQY